MIILESSPLLAICLNLFFLQSSANLYLGKCPLASRRQETYRFLHKRESVEFYSTPFYSESLIVPSLSAVALHLVVRGLYWILSQFSWVFFVDCVD